MYKSDWFSKEAMMKWEEINGNDKMWLKCQQFFKVAYITIKWKNKAKGQMQEIINRMMNPDWNLYLEAMKAKAMQ